MDACSIHQVFDFVTYFFKLTFVTYLKRQTA